MPYLIDGHNLIPKIPWLRLTMIDDEDKLIQLLQDFTQSHKKTIEVFFDKAPAGHAGKHSFGRVTARFVREGSTADSAIAARLRTMKNARDWIVVSSDHQVQSYARIAGATVMSSDEFARMLLNSPAASQDKAKPEPGNMSSEELQSWLDLFNDENNRHNPYG